ncbi:putative tubulin-specific chaperone Rbl2 [Kalaharituber pfeilii]|nr:putative tubulin-specific chaperone Rbl2 [Kalaharituber pfeilii]
MPAPSSLSIKTSSVLRLTKEEKSYHKELASAKKSLESMLAEEGEADEYAIKQQRKVVEETKAMIPTVRKNLEDAVSSLETELESSGSEPEDAKEKARNAIKDARELLSEEI